MTLLIRKRSIFELSVLPELKKLILLATVTKFKLEYSDRLNASSMSCPWCLEVSFSSEYAVGHCNISVRKILVSYPEDGLNLLKI